MSYLESLKCFIFICIVLKLYQQVKSIVFQVKSEFNCQFRNVWYTCNAFHLKYFKFYCNPNKLGTPRFQSLKRMEFQKNCSLSNLISSLKLKEKSVLYQYLSKTLQESKSESSYPLFPFFSILLHFLFTTNYPSPFSIHVPTPAPHTTNLNALPGLVYMIFILYLPLLSLSLSQLFICESFHLFNLFPPFTPV